MKNRHLGAGGKHGHAIPNMIKRGSLSSQQSSPGYDFVRNEEVHGTEKSKLTMRGGSLIWVSGPFAIRKGGKKSSLEEEEGNVPRIDRFCSKIKGGIFLAKGGEG